MSSIGKPVVLAPVAGEVPVAAVDHGEAGAHVAGTFDGTWPDLETPAIWEHFLVQGSFPRSHSRRRMELRLSSARQSALKSSAITSRHAP